MSTREQPTGRKLTTIEERLNERDSQTRNRLRRTDRSSDPGRGREKQKGERERDKRERKLERQPDGKAAENARPEIDAALDSPFDDLLTNKRKRRQPEERPSGHRPRTATANEADHLKSERDTDERRDDAKQKRPLYAPCPCLHVLSRLVTCLTAGQADVAGSTGSERPRDHQRHRDQPGETGSRHPRSVTALNPRDKIGRVAPVLSSASAAVLSYLSAASREHDDRGESQEERETRGDSGCTAECRNQ